MKANREPKPYSPLRTAVNNRTMTMDLLKSIRMTQSMTPNSFFETFEKNTHMLPKFYSEVANELEDITDVLPPIVLTVSLLAS